MRKGQAEEAEGPERRPKTSDQRDRRSSRRRREKFKKQRTAHSVICYREVNTEDLSDVDDFRLFV